MLKGTTLNAGQIERIIDKVVPVVAAPADQELFRGVLHCVADTCNSSGEFAYFISKMLKAGAANKEG